MRYRHKNDIQNAYHRIQRGCHHDPFEFLGRQQESGKTVIRVFSPHTRALQLPEAGVSLERIGSSDLFEWRGDKDIVPLHYQLQRQDSSGQTSCYVDPYSFVPQISDYDLHLFGEGRHWKIYNVLGAHVCTVDDILGVQFAVWAPNAERVSVIGDFNIWDGRCHAMRSRGSSGVWELFVPGLSEGVLYKFELRNRDNGAILGKADPYARGFELRPRTASVVVVSRHDWRDRQWMENRKESVWLHAPMSIYEVHLGSWQRNDSGEYCSYHELAHRLVAYVKELGFTHIELLPVTEHPLDASWGYQTTGYFAPTRRFGSPDDFRYFIDVFHQAGIGVLLDWVPAHFPKDEFALAQFDGSALYEHAYLGEHPDWGTLIFNYGRNEVRNFLIASALYWMDEFHIDGLRVDAVASMLYLDYSREDGAWSPNVHGGNENIEAIEFLRELNRVTHTEHPGIVMAAEESTAWPQVTRPPDLGGLGFSMKWNMGWMHDTLEYMRHNPVHRSYQHDQLTFGLLYLFSENFVLPLSHDEVVHGKGSLLNKMPGDEWQRFANLRLLYTYMFTYPGKKLLFMGCEFGQGSEWQHDRNLDWYVLDYSYHQGVQRLVTDLNALYRTYPALHRHDFDPEGFAWIDCHDYTQSVLSYLRKYDGGFLVVALNFTPVPRESYRIGVPEPGTYRECINSDSTFYSGGNIGNRGTLMAEDTPWMGYPCSLSLTLPPLAALVFERL